MSATASSMVAADLVERREISVDGAAIRYRLWPKPRANALGMLFLHGYRAHARWWDHIVPYFADEYHVATMDFSGLGDSDWRDDYTAVQFAREVLAVAADAGLTPVTIVAHSFGGTPSAHAAALSPGSIRRAIIIDSRMMISSVPDPDPSEVPPLRFENRVFPSEQETVSRFRLLPESTAVPAALFDYVARHSVRAVDGGWAWKFDARLDPMLRNDPDRWVPEGLHTPIDYLYGDRSDVISPKLAHQIASFFPNAGVPVAIPNSNHHVLLEQPDALIAAVRALLAREPA